MTDQVTCRGEAPRMRALAIRLRSASRTPWKALPKTTKKTITTPSATLDGMPSPSAMTKMDPSTTRGMELAILM